MSNMVISYGTLDELKQIFAEVPKKRQFIDTIQRYLRQWNESHPQQHAHATFVPIINEKYLDIFELFGQVQSLGGFEHVNRDQKWGLVASRLGFPSIETANLVMQAYTSLLLAFEQSMRSSSNASKSQPIISNVIPSQPTTAQTSSMMPRPILPTPSYPTAMPKAPMQPSSTSSYPNSSSSHHMTQIPIASTLTANQTNNKRSRPADNLIPSTITAAIPAVEVFSDRLNVAVRELNSKDPMNIAKSLNYLTQKSYELTDMSAIQVENCPQLLISIAALLDVVNPIGTCLFPVDTISSFSLHDTGNWSLALPSKGNHEFKILAQGIDSSPFLYPILNILRNLTMEGFNELLIASSLRIMRHIIALLIACEASIATISDTTSIAFDIIHNIAGKLDITGRRKQYHHSWLDDQSDASNKRFLLRCKVTENASDASIYQYQHIMLSMMAFLSMLTIQYENRSLLMRSLDIMIRLVQNSDNHIIFNRAPDAFIDAMVNLICMSNTDIEPMAYMDVPSFSMPSTAAAATRKPPACIGVSSHDIMDMEIRDIALDIMLAMIQSSSTLQIRFAKVPRIVPILLKVCDTSRVKFRNEAMQKAINILIILGQRPENIKAFQAVHVDMIVASGHDDAITELLMSLPPSSLYPAHLLAPGNAS